MGWIKKAFKELGRGLRRIGREVGRGMNKAFGKHAPLVGVLLSVAGFGFGLSSLLTGATATARVLGAISALGNAGSIIAGQVAKNRLKRAEREQRARLEKLEKQFDLLQKARDFEPVDFDFLAGGALYNACYAGGFLYNPTQLIDPRAKAFGIAPVDLNNDFLNALHSPYERLAGGSLYDSTWKSA